MFLMLTMGMRKVMIRGVLSDLLCRHRRNHKLAMKLVRKERKWCIVAW